jgi:peptide/nickel transport system substrate-binding protein
MKRARLLALGTVVNAICMMVLSSVGITLRVAVAAESMRELRVAQIGDPVQLDCWDYTSVDEADILAHFAEPLFRFDHKINVSGWLVETWESPSPTEYILHIRKGVKFHDPAYGELKAEDVAASLDACYAAGTRSASRVPKAILERQVDILDDYTLKLSLAEPGTVALPNYFADAYITSKKYLEKVGREGFTRQPMGTGPYTFVEWIPNQRVVGKRFEGYWGPKQAFDRLVWRVIPDAFTRKSEFLTGGLDVLPFLVPEVVPEVEANPNVHVEKVLSSRYIFIVLPVRTPPYTDKRVRQALNYAVNKEEIVEILFRSIGAVPLRGVLHPMLGELKDPALQPYTYNPEKAKQLLEEARQDGVQIGTITLYAPNDRYTLDKEMGEAVADYWRAIGLEVTFIPQSRSVLFPPMMALQHNDPALIGNGNILGLPEWPFTLWLQKREQPRSRGAHYAAAPDAWDAKIAELEVTPLDDPKRVALARELDALFTDYAPWVFLINYIDLYGVRNDLTWTPHPMEKRLFIEAKPQ